MLSSGYQRHVSMSLVVGLLALQYSDRLHDLLACWAFAVWFLFCSISLLQGVLVGWPMDVSPQSIFGFPERRMAVIFVGQNCCLGGLLPPFWHLGGRPLGAPWGTMAAAGRTREDPETGF